jgi:GNAT superfamily N-acetyltransferase
VSPSKGSSDLKFHPVTPERWEDLEDLFGQRGACGGCWCMWWRLTQTEFNRRKGQGNKQAMKKIVRSGQIPGILAYAGGQPVGWCSIGPREVYPRLERSRILQRVDERPVWSVVCFFVAKPYRRKGVTAKLLSAAVEYARKKGAEIVEGYPVEPKKKQAPDVFLYNGLASAFRQAGFQEVARRSETRPIMRYSLQRP